MKKIKNRNWHAVNAQFRSSAGAIPDKKKEVSKTICRTNTNITCLIWEDCPCPEKCKEECIDFLLVDDD